jgi:hypothetical protein
MGRSDEPFILPPRMRTAKSSADEPTIEVPLGEWRRTQKQLNDLVKLSERLADVTERAAKAETEVSLLRQQVAELRTERENRKGTSTRRGRRSR